MTRGDALVVAGLVLLLGWRIVAAFRRADRVLRDAQRDVQRDGDGS